MLCRNCRPTTLERVTHLELRDEMVLIADTEGGDKPLMIREAR
jgi:hypothetical protein